MNTTLKDKIVYVSENERETIKKLVQQMASFTADFSNIAHTSEKIRFTEFSLLYQDLHYFYETDILKKMSVSLSDLKSFSNSFYAIYCKTESLFSPTSTDLNLFLFHGYSIFHNWFRRGCIHHDIDFCS